jgi:flagellin
MSSKSVNLTASERESLTSLKQTSKMREVTERRLSTGLKVSWPAEDAPAYFVASSLRNRAGDLTEKKDRIDQAINLLTAAQVALSGADSVLKQMQGLALSVTVADSETARQFNGLLNQLDNLINDAEYQGVNLLANQSASSTSTSVSSLTVEFSDKDESKVVINGEFAGSAYYMDAGGESKLIPASTGLSFTQSGVTGTQEARDASDVQVNTSTVNHQHGQDIAPMSDGGYLVVWEDLGGVDGDSAGVLAQRYDSSGVAVGVETQINTTTAGLQGHPTIATLSDGSYVVTWQAANAYHPSIFLTERNRV